MKKKIVGIFVMTLLIATVYSSVGLEENTSNISNDSIAVADQKNIGDDAWFEMLEGNFYAQGFTPSETPLSKVQLRINTRVNPPENTNLTISIRDDLKGDDITTGQINMDEITGNYVEFSFPDIDVTIGEVYYIICSVDKGYSYLACYAWPYSFYDKYDRGDGWYSENGIIWYPAEDYTLEGTPGVDFYFTTYWKDWGPDACEIDGPTEGKANEKTDYTFCTNDPEGHDVRYYIEWGDGLELIWIGPFESGEIATRGHSWASEGNYTIRVKAKDKYGAEGEWTELEISMPKTKTTNKPFLTFLENHPNLFPLLRQIMGL